MDIHGTNSTILGLVFIAALISFASGINIIPNAIGLRTCDNSTDRFHICWDEVDADDIRGYCTFLQNSWGIESEFDFTEFGQPTRYTFGRLRLISTYSGCVVLIPISGGNDDDEDVACSTEIRKDTNNATCITFKPSGRGWNLENILAVACIGYIVVLYVIVRLADNLCPYTRNTKIDYHDLYLMSEKERLKGSARGRKSQKQKRVDSIKERARRRSDAVAQVVASPTASSRTPSTASTGTTRSTSSGKQSVKPSRSKRPSSTSSTASTQSNTSGSKTGKRKSPRSPSSEKSPNSRSPLDPISETRNGPRFFP